MINILLIKLFFKQRKITGVNNLDEVRSIELKVDSRKTSISNVGMEKDYKILSKLYFFYYENDNN